MWVCLCVQESNELSSCQFCVPGFFTWWIISFTAGSLQGCEGAEQHFTVKPVPSCCCRSVCSPSPSRRPCRPAAPSDQTRPPSTLESPLWTPCTQTPVTDTKMMSESLRKFMFHRAPYATRIHLITSWKWSFLNMPMLTWLSSPIFAWNFLIPSLVTPGGRQHTDHHLWENSLRRTQLKTTFLKKRSETRKFLHIGFFYWLLSSCCK